MPRPDLNLLVTLDVLLEEGSVTRAGERLRLSPSAMSRSLARLRRATGDPLLVRAGRGLVPTPRALELAGRVHDLVLEAEAVLRPTDAPDLEALVRTFTLRTGDGFVDSFGPDLVARVAAEAPGVQLRFIRKTNTDPAGLRNGTVDLETGVVDQDLTPEVRTRTLFRDRFVGVTRQGHPLSAGEITGDGYAAARHVHVSRRGLLSGLIDEAIRPSGMSRRISAVVDGFAAALALARATDLVATVPERHTAILRGGMHTFDLPFPTPTVTVSLLWHVRLDSDAAHRWLRACIIDVCAGQTGETGQIGETGQTGQTAGAV